MAGTILIVDDVATNRIVLKVKLGAACYQPLMAADGAGCLRLAREARPDLILLDVALPDIPGVEVLQRLRSDPLTRDIPVVMVAGTADPALRRAALLAGADDYFVKPVDDALLMARLRNLRRTHEALAELGQRGDTLQALGLAEDQAGFARPGTIALVCDRPEEALRWRRDMAPHLSDQLLTLHREEALAQTSGPDCPDIFVIDGDLGGRGGGLRLMSELRSRSATRHAGIVLLHPNARADDLAMAYDMGANEAMETGHPAAELALRLRALLRRKHAADRLRATVQDGLRLAVIDPLTGLYNRRYALPRLATIADRAQMLGTCFAVMVIDLDRFKAVNDCFGHAGGDSVLAEVAHRLAENLRASDLVARIGGEEFLVALPDTGLPEAQQIAERLCRMVQEAPIALPDGRSLSVTVSIGLAVAAGSKVATQDVAHVVDRADRALLDAKAQGRNQVMLDASAA